MDKREVFWQRLEELLASSEIVIDRPRGSRHPRYTDIVYGLDYGYLNNTTSTDGEGVDIWLGSDSKRGLDAVICTVDLDNRDAELKLMVGCTAEELRYIEDFYNDYPQMGGYIVKREL